MPNISIDAEMRLWIIVLITGLILLLNSKFPAWIKSKWSSITLPIPTPDLPPTFHELSAAVRKVGYKIVMRDGMIVLEPETATDTAPSVIPDRDDWKLNELNERVLSIQRSNAKYNQITIDLDHRITELDKRLAKLEQPIG